MDMQMGIQNTDFAQQITASQQRLFGYIFSLLGENAASWDVLQECNLVLWRKQADFRPGTNFFAWAATVARFQVMAYLRDRARDPLRVLTPELLEAFGEEAELEAEHLDLRHDALRRCLTALGNKGRAMVAFFYSENLSTEEIGKRIGARPNAVKQTLFRIRRKLRDCIDLALTE
jgi:RNA polymerase sigma-70 factor (ECF subfamily)